MFATPFLYRSRDIKGTHNNGQCSLVTQNNLYSSHNVPSCTASARLTARATAKQPFLDIALFDQHCTGSFSTFLMPLQCHNGREEPHEQAHSLIGDFLVYIPVLNCTSDFLLLSSPHTRRELSSASSFLLSRISLITIINDLNSSSSSSLIKTIYTHYLLPSNPPHKHPLHNTSLTLHQDVCYSQQDLGPGQPRDHRHRWLQAR
jgi:hypothetical protein